MPAFRFLISVVAALTAHAADDFLANWMGQTADVTGTQTVLDLALAGTHDSLTSDLSDTVSDGANDLPSWVSWLLHTFHDIAPGSFIKQQAQTQTLGMKEQLEAGLRFIDFRLMYTASPDSSSSKEDDWYVLHLVESNHPAMTYLKEARQFLDEHPTEVVCMAFSYHGGFGNGGYPGVSTAVKQAFWKEVQALFDGVLMDSRVSSTNATTLNDLVKQNHRLILYVSDYQNFTQGSPFALDPVLHLDNQLGEGDVKDGARIVNMIGKMKSFVKQIPQHKAKNVALLQSMAAGFPSSQEKDAALIHFLKIGADHFRKECASDHGIPNMTDWCPMSLYEEGRLTNYYNQIVLDLAVTQPNEALALPHFIYLDAVDANGCLQMGPTDASLPNSGAAYAYVDTLVLYNLNNACKKPSANQLRCEQLIKLVQKRRAAFPLLRWEDPSHGRLAFWPPYNG